jgi:L-alanine-DL-glutamate epimerase-like enolase superfamily enzyme
MKLTAAKTYVVKTDPPNWGGILWCFREFETDAGIEGWGETAVLNCLF